MTEVEVARYDRRIITTAVSVVFVCCFIITLRFTLRYIFLVISITEWSLLVLLTVIGWW